MRHSFVPKLTKLPGKIPPSRKKWVILLICLSVVFLVTTLSSQKLSAIGWISPEFRSANATVWMLVRNANERESAHHVKWIYMRWKIGHYFAINKYGSNKWTDGSLMHNNNLWNESNLNKNDWAHESNNLFSFQIKNGWIFYGWKKHKPPINQNQMNILRKRDALAAALTGNNTFMPLEGDDEKESRQIVSSRSDLLWY